MRTRPLAVFGCALLSAITGCAVTQHQSDGLRPGSPEPDATAAAAVAPSPRCGQSSNADGSAWPGAGGGAADAFRCSHPRVETFVVRFQTNLRGFFGGALSRSGRYVPGMASILEQEGVPPELVYLPLIESGFRLRAVSRAGAVGPWQLIRATGRRYGLRIDRYVDERRDPVKSTRAAARYLHDLHALFGDWHLSLAAYNTGEGNIARILERRHVVDFWQMSAAGYLYEETRNYVPAFLAALHIAAAPELYGFEPPSPQHLGFDVVRVKRWIRLSTVATLSGTSTAAIKELNPALQRGVVPAGYVVRVPKGSKAAFRAAYNTLACVSRGCARAVSLRRAKTHLS